jgi:hypothetical protein
MCPSQTFNALFVQTAYPDFSLSWWLIIDDNYILGLYHMDLGGVADIMELHAAYIFWAEACRNSPT